jgi:hypothetical protein
MSMMHVSFLPSKMKSGNNQQHGQYSEGNAITGRSVLLQYNHQIQPSICRCSKLLGFNTPGIHITFCFELFLTVAITTFAHHHPKCMQYSFWDIMV